MGEKREGPRVRYSALSTQEDVDNDREFTSKNAHHEDLRYRFELREEIPWKSIALALFLLAFGSLFLVTSHFIFTAHMGGDSSQAYGFLVLGFLLFLPGFYETRIAYYSWRGHKGYSFSRIPAY
ncbi:hypothetical protein R1sor_025000 [Riccia sorocarpa]|uniref:Transmembrane protein 230 n=1 Tax=Riccia sorocarpa TaxID=122646 RepID=A0ABD3GA36_9MARC